MENPLKAFTISSCFPGAFELPKNILVKFKKRERKKKNTIIVCFWKELLIKAASFFRNERQNNWKLQV
jgi:hypothetical protein